MVIETLTQHAHSMTRFDTDNKDFEQRLCDVIQVGVYSQLARSRELIVILAPGLEPALEQLLVRPLGA